MGEMQFLRQIQMSTKRLREATMRPTTYRRRHDDHQSNGSNGIASANAGKSGSKKKGRSSREQLDRAAQVQRSLLPDVSGSIGGYRIDSAYRPCEALGGDFFDIYRSDDRVMLMVADVMGHGAEAALITMLLKAVFHESAPHIVDADVLLTKMNQDLLGLIPDGTFAATTVVSLDPNSSEVQLSNAGQPYPFVLRASTQSVHKVRLAGVPLGMNVNGSFQEYDVFKVKLAPGDVLLVSSDGIGAIEREDGRCFEDVELSLALSRLVGLAGERVIQSLLANALEFSGGRPFPDDVNLIAVSRDQDPQRH